MAAARALFLAGDYQSVSLRAIAREAGVDTSLVSYYFGSKQALYNEAMSLPNGPHRIVADVCSGTDPDHLGEALVKAFIDAWDGHLGLGGPDP
ncbi:MAG: helix-turn-helix domain-containing protein, partial [Cutibacterium avidum]|nr:helix-turn-helix domain-containing protein [Cutibacterium avidum]